MKSAVMKRKSGKKLLLKRLVVGEKKEVREWVPKYDGSGHVKSDKIKIHY